MKVVITGSSGMVGQGVLLECLESAKVKEILVINRKTIALENPKLKEVLIDNFFEVDTIKQDLKGYDACFFCIGTSSIGKNEITYSKMTYDLTINFAQAFLEQNDNSVFCYVTGAGTDSTEQGRTMWAKVKGKTENAIMNMPFKATFMFRPGYIQPLKGIKLRSNWYTPLYVLFSFVYLILQYFPTTATNTVNIGKAMIKVAEGDYTSKILANKGINELAKE